MAIIISEPVSANGDIIKDEWLDGRKRLFRRGEDFKSRPEAWCRQFRKAARDKGKRATCRIRDDELVEASAI